jgi:hypothetical protein
MGISPTHINERTTCCEWYTPAYIFVAIGNPLFDMDVASPGADIVPWINAKVHLTEKEDGLLTPRYGFIWCNAPCGRTVLPLWLDKFNQHGNGIALTTCPVPLTLMQFSVKLVHKKLVPEVGGPFRKISG